MESLVGKALELVAAAVLQYLVDKTDLAERVKGWLKRDPATLAYQRALLRAYTAFARAYPDLAKSLFDSHFLRGPAVPELAKQLMRGESPNAVELIHLWANSLYGETYSKQRDEFVKNGRHILACTEFLERLAAELKHETVFDPIHDSKALDELEQNVAELVRVLTAQRDEATAQAEKYQTVTHITGDLVEGDKILGDKVAGDKFSGDKIAGDKNVTNNYFGGDFASLKDLYIAPDQVFKRVRVEEFVGREWLVSKVENFINNSAHTSGYLRIEGEAGVGKTSFLAHLVYKRNYLHILSDELRGDNNVRPALLSLGAQLVARYRLEPFISRDTLPVRAASADFLYQLLDNASKQLSAGEKIVVVCDALDDAGIGMNGNAFGLPSTLPQNVYFIVTQRPVPIQLELKTPAVVERLHPGDSKNFKDIREYLNRIGTDPEIARRLAAHHYSLDVFVNSLTEKSGGVWIYLQYVIEEIRNGLRQPLQLENLPNGLVGYYLNYWNDWRFGRNRRGNGADAWDALYLPLVSTLPAAQEPLTLTALLSWAGVKTSAAHVRRLLREDWGAFIEERGGDRVLSRFALYHSSLRDFLIGAIPTDEMTQADTSFVYELRDANVAAHRRIVAFFRAECDGKWTELLRDDYARIYLSRHLEGARDFDTLVAIMILSDVWCKLRAEYEESYSGYLSDLERTWELVESSDKYDIGYQIRCALLKSTIQSLVRNIFPELLVQLVETRLWSGGRALGQLPHIPDDLGKAVAIERLSPHLEERLLSSVLTVTRGMQDSFLRSRALNALAAQWPTIVLSDALKEAYAIDDTSLRVRALGAAAMQLPSSERSPVLSDALKMARNIQVEEDRAETLSVLVSYLPPDLVTEVLSLVRESRNDNPSSKFLSPRSGVILDRTVGDDLQGAFSHGIQSPANRVIVLSAVASRLMPEERHALARELFATMPNIQDESQRSKGLNALAKVLPYEMLYEALELARSIKDDISCVSAMCSIAVHLPLTENQLVVSELLGKVRGIQASHTRTNALSILAPYLSPQMVDEVLVLVRQIQNKAFRADILRRVVMQMPETEKGPLVVEALTAARGIEDQSARANALISVASAIVSGEKASVVSEALGLMREIHDESGRATALGAIAAYLSSDTVRKAFLLIGGIKNESAKANALEALASYLAPDMVGDALELVRTFDDDFARANVLRVLARQSESESVDDMLAIARRIQDVFSRVGVLCSLAVHLPQSQKRSLISEALMSARKLWNPSARANALVTIASIMSSEEQHVVLKRTLRAISEIENEFSQMRTLTLLSPLLNGDMVGQALALARNIKLEFFRANALLVLSTQVPFAEKTSIIAEALAAAHTIQDAYDRANLLCAIAAELPFAEKRLVINDVFREVREIPDEVAQAKALGVLAAQLPIDLLQDAITHAQSLRKESARIRALAGIAKYLSGNQQIALLEELFPLILQVGEIYWLERQSLLQTLTSTWEAHKFTHLESKTWYFTLHALANHPRRESLYYLSALFPMIQHLGGQPAINEMFYAIRDVTEWWP